MFYTMNVAGLKRQLPICKVTDSLYIAGFVIFGDPELTVACARELLAKAPAYDYIITAEAKGIPLAHEMARQAGDAKYILARKGPKLYMRDIFEVSVHSITTAKEQHLYLDGADAALMKGKKILVVDDVISTGESLEALEALVEKLKTMTPATLQKIANEVLPMVSTSMTSSQITDTLLTLLTILPDLQIQTGGTCPVQDLYWGEEVDIYGDGQYHSVLYYDEGQVKKAMRALTEGETE